MIVNLWRCHHQSSYLLGPLEMMWSYWGLLSWLAMPNAFTNRLWLMLDTVLVWYWYAGSKIRSWRGLFLFTIQGECIFPKYQNPCQYFFRCHCFLHSFFSRSNYNTNHQNWWPSIKRAVSDLMWRVIIALLGID